MHRTLLLAALAAPLAFTARFHSADLLKFRAVGAVQFSPDGSRIAYTIVRNDVPRRPVAQLSILTIADAKSISLASGDDASGEPTWSPDGKWLAYSGTLDSKHGLIVVHPDGSGKKFLAATEGTNSPLPSTGKTVAWSPDSKRIAYVSATPGPETAAATSRLTKALR